MAVTHLGRVCEAVDGAGPLLRDVELADGTIDLELAVTAERSFHGVVWRARDELNYESFFVRPHQVGNPDAVQYTPVFNDIPAWQLYHGDGFWAPVSFPIGDWFTIRVVFAGERAEIYVADLETPALVCRLRMEPARGRVGILAAGPGLHVARFEHDAGTSFRLPPRAPDPVVPGALLDWEVSEAFAESELANARPRTWTPIRAEPSGLLDLARVQGIHEGRNTVLARTVIESREPREQLLELGFSDRAVVHLNGRRLYRGSDGYRSRDYRFLGSIGWYDALYLPLEAGANELVVAVSEDFGGWGVQARLVD